MKSGRLRSLAIAAAILFLQLFLPSTIRTREAMLDATKGFPIPMLVQDLTAIDHPLPYRYGFDSPWENPTEIVWPGIIIDFAIFFLLAEILTEAYTAFRKRGH